MEFIIIWLFFAIGCAVVASNKGRSGAGWFFAGAIFGVFAFVLALIVKPVSQESRDRLRDTSSIV